MNKSVGQFFLFHIQLLNGKFSWWLETFRLQYVHSTFTAKGWQLFWLSSNKKAVPHWLMNWEEWSFNDLRFTNVSILLFSNCFPNDPAISIHQWLSLYFLHSLQRTLVYSTPQYICVESNILKHIYIYLLLKSHFMLNLSHYIFW